MVSDEAGCVVRSEAGTCDVTHDLLWTDMVMMTKE